MSTTPTTLAAIACLALPAAAYQAVSAPCPDEVAELVRRGRELIAADKADEAFPILERALAKDGGRARTRVWLIRCDIGRGRLNDALDATDELAAGGEQGPALDYLHGLALCARAQEYIAQGVAGQMIEMNFRDAFAFLRAATEAEPETFADAFLPLAQAGWYAQELPVARAAAEKAVALRPRGVDEPYTLGRVALSQFVVANADEVRRAEADLHWSAAEAAFQAAVRNAGRPTEPAARTRLARAHLQIAHALQWKQRREQTLRSYADALAWDPGVVDFGALWQIAPPAEFEQCVAGGLRAWRQHNPGQTHGTMVWWLGYARFVLRRYEQAEQDFLAALELLPDYLATHWYIGLSRYHQQDFQGAIDSLALLFSEDPETALAMAGADRALNLSILGYLVGQCEQAGRKADAARLCEIHVGVDPEDALWWSYVGLFWRDAGDLLRSSTEAADVEARERHWERAWEGYSRALSIEPDNPAYLNDGAVVLHYNLRRELDRARAMYVRAHERALEELARDDLSDDLRRLYETAKRDSADNLRRLDAGDSGR